MFDPFESWRVCDLRLDLSMASSQAPRRRASGDMLARVSTFIAALDRDSFPIATRQVADRIGIAKSTAHTALQGLVAQGHLSPSRKGYSLDEKSSNSLVSETVSLIEQQLATGQLQPEDFLASQLDLAKTLNVSTYTVLAVLRELGRGDIGAKYRLVIQVPNEAFISSRGITFTGNRKAVTDHLREIVNSYPHGWRLPSYRCLSELLGVHEDVAYTAVRQLKLENLVTTRTGPQGGEFIQNWKDILRREAQSSPWMRRVNKVLFVAHTIAKHADKIPVGAKITTATIVKLFEINKTAANLVRAKLKHAGVLEVHTMSAGTQMGTPPYAGLNDVLIDEATAESWRATRAQYALPDRKGGIAELVAFDVRTRIEKGQLLPGAPLPAKATLRAIYEVDDHVINDFYRLLENETLIARHSSGYLIHSTAKQNSQLPGVSPLGKQIWQDRETNKTLKEGALSHKALQRRYNVSQTAVDAAVRQLKYLGAWRNARPAQMARANTIRLAQQ